MTEARIGLYILTIVSVVAIVGLVTVYLNSGSAAVASEDEKSIAGEAIAAGLGTRYGFGPSSYQDFRAGKIRTPQPVYDSKDKQGVAQHT